MPADPVRGRRWAGHRRTLEAIAWNYRTKSPWRDLPEQRGSSRTPYEATAPWLTPVPKAPPERRGGSQSGRGCRRSRAATGRRPWRGRPA
nr:transposase [Streptomyces sp. NRRL WC-3725]